MNNVVNTIGGRKAAACLTGLAVLVGCFLYKGALPNELVEAVKYLITTYLAGNIAADVVAGVQTAALNKATAESKYDDSAISQRLSSIEQAVSTQDQTLRQVVAVIQSK
jgi:rRNA-processing protein FCF1